MSDQIKKYLEQNRECLNVKGIEIKAGVAQGTLTHFLFGLRGLSKKSAGKIEAVLVGLKSYKND